MLRLTLALNSQVIQNTKIFVVNKFSQAIFFFFLLNFYLETYFRDNIKLIFLHYPGSAETVNSWCASIPEDATDVLSGLTI